MIHVRFTPVPTPPVGMEEVPVATTDELGPGDRKFVRVDDIEIAVLNLDGDYYAVRNSCPHMEGPVGRGRTSRHGDQRRIQCPFHGWTFDLDSGNALFGLKRLRTFDVTVADGEVRVTL